MKRYKELSAKMNASIQLGYVTEEDWPERPFTKPLPDAERSWLAEWLIGEGWTHG